jgi:hypothetical protein
MGIYSLNEPPRLLRTITGGSDYSAADTDLDGRIEIWTNDAEAINGFENIPLNALDFAPPVVLRFEQKQLIDVSSEFRSDFDRQIATLRTQLNDQQLSEFKHSDGALSNKSSLLLDLAHSLSTTKITVLEMVWCYLYSDREPQAWKALAEMWPESDYKHTFEADNLANTDSHQTAASAGCYPSRAYNGGSGQPGGRRRRKSALGVTPLQ